MVRGVFLGAAALALLRPSAAHPMEKVIGLLEKLGEQVESEHKAEEVTYTKFEYWCKNSRKTLGKAIEEGKANIERLSSEIESHTKNIEVLTAGIKEHEQELQDLDATAAKADKQREDGKALYEEESTSLQATVQAVDEAIKALVDARGKTGGFLLAQQRAQEVLALAGSVATPQQFAMLQKFVAEPAPARPDLKAKGDYEGHVDEYSFKSGSVIDLLKELKLKFEDELTTANTEETNAVNQYQLAKEARDQLRKATEDSKAEKETVKGEAEASMAQAEGDRENARGDLEADTTALEDTEKSCDMKKSEWAERSETRKLEQEAIVAAIKLLSKVTGVRTEAPTNPGLPPSPVEAGEAGLLQEGASPGAAQRALNLLRQEAKEEHSRSLDRLADVVAARVGKKGPYDDIINMIQKMIFREMNAQKEEDEHKNWCDMELNKTNASIEDKQGKMDELSLKIKEHEASAMELAKEIEEANIMVEKITAHVEEATEIRKIGKEENTLAIKDAQEAQTALSNAIAVLKDFYKSSGKVPKESFELLQARVVASEPVQLPETPSTWEAGYTGVADPKAQPDGIIAVLEQISADFAKMESETLAQENSDKQAYDEDMKSCSIEKARRAKESDMKGQERKRILEKQAEMQETHKTVAGEKEATEQYLKDLQPACVDGDSTYEQRKADRATTIEALKKAQDILQSENATKTEPAPKSFLQLRGSRG